MNIVRLILLSLYMMALVSGGALAETAIQQKRYTHEQDSTAAYQESKEFVICDGCENTDTLNRRETPRLSVTFSGGKETVLKDEAKEVIQYQQPESIPYTVYFGYNTHTLPEDEKEQLKSLATVLIEDGYHEFEAIGYADSTGSEEYNLMLSGKRADSVTEILSSLGGEPSQSEGRGTCCTLSSDEESRRVEILFRKGGK